MKTTRLTKINSPPSKTAKVGLALGGGAARGLAHIGVLKALDEESIPIDMLAGTSAGAVVGACYARDRNVASLEEIAIGIDWKQVARFTDLNLILLGKGFIQGQKIKSLLNSIINDAQFADLKVPFAVVAADIQRMEEIVINKGSVVDAVRASISVPVAFTPVKWGSNFLVDGGIVNPLPVNVVRDMGAEVIVAVNVISADQPPKQRRPVKQVPKPTPSPHSEITRSSVVRKKIDDLLSEHKDTINYFDELSSAAKARISASKNRIDPQTPGIFNVLMQLVHALEYERMKQAVQAADIVISPDVSNIGAFGFHKGKEAIAQGYKATKDILPQLREAIRCP